MNTAAPWMEPPLRSSRAMRIAICVQALGPLRRMLDEGIASDGTYVVQGYVAEGLTALGHHLTFLAPVESGGVECADGPRTPRTVGRTWSTHLWFRIASAACWRLQRWLRLPYLNVFSNYRVLDACLRCLPGHDLAYERNALYHDGVARACRRLGLPYVMFFEADQVREGEYSGHSLPRLLRWRASRVLRFNLKTAACVICVSESARSQLISTWGAEPRKTVVCRNGVDVRRFAPDPVARADVRRSLGLDTHPLVVFVGSFFEWHDISGLLGAFALLRARAFDARLVLAGHGRTWDAMRAQVQAAGLGDVVRFTGLMSHRAIPGLLSAADVAVAPYPGMKHELWFSPLKLFEYMASGVAIVASDAGQVSQVIRDRSNGLLVPPGDVPAMAAAIEELVADGGLRRRLGAQAREDALREHSWDRYNERLASLFRAVLDGRHPADSGGGD